MPGYLSGTEGTGAALYGLAGSRGSCGAPPGTGVLMPWQQNAEQVLALIHELNFKNAQTSAAEYTKHEHLPEGAHFPGHSHPLALDVTHEVSRSFDTGPRQGRTSSH